MKAGAEAGREAVGRNRLAIGMASAILAGIIDITWALAEHKSREAIAARVVIYLIVVPIFVFTFHKLRAE
jgi:hypothetical protein